MARVVKIPLVMKNGEKATDMKSLKANFDIESVIGYFMDGKLLKWLSDRYYEDEAEAIFALSKDDPELAQKICSIFDVKYEGNQLFDAEDIAWRNARIAHLRQFTADESIIARIDNVAFTQEELAELYDRNIPEIYLCDGEFRIPKSKCLLHYVYEGLNATVHGLSQEETKTSELPKSEEKIAPVSNNESRLSEDVADKIVYWHNGSHASINKDFIETPNYIVVRDDAPKGAGALYGFYRVDKKTGSRQILANADILKGINSDEWAVFDDTIIMPYSYNDENSYIIPLDTMIRKKLPVKFEHSMFSSNKRVMNTAYVAWLDCKEIQILDISTMRTHYVLNNTRDKQKAKEIFLKGNLLYMINDPGYDENFYLLVYDIQNKKIIQKVGMPELSSGYSFDGLFEFQNQLFTFVSSYWSASNEIQVYQYSIGGNRNKFEIAFNFTIPEGMNFASRAFKVAENKIIYVNDRHQLSAISLADHSTLKLSDACAKIEHYKTGVIFRKQHSYTTINDFVVLGDYVYYEDDHRIFRVDMTENTLSEVIGERP